jgi:hypothetical protein
VSSRVSNECLFLKTPTKARAGKVLVILSWGAVAWYRSFLPSMTVGELRRQLAKELGRLFDGEVVGVELVLTGTDISPGLEAPLRDLTHPPYRNVCLDAIAAPRAPAVSLNGSVGERLLRKHMSQERFQAGVDRLMWRLVELTWPSAVYAIRSSFGGEWSEVAFRLNFAKYPLAPPVVELWDLETQAPIHASDWPEFFINFASQNYPQFADFVADSYCANLLRISAQVAHRLKAPTSDEWDPRGDLTQLLARAYCSFRTPQPDQSHPSEAAKGNGNSSLVSAGFNPRWMRFPRRVDRISST